MDAIATVALLASLVSGVILAVMQWRRESNEFDRLLEIMNRADKFAWKYQCKKSLFKHLQGKNNG